MRHRLLLGYEVPDHYGPFAVADAPKSRVLFQFEANEGVWNGSDRANQTKSLMRLSSEIRNKTSFNPDNRDFAAELRRFKDPKFFGSSSGRLPD